MTLGRRLLSTLTLMVLCAIVPSLIFGFCVAAAYYPAGRWLPFRVTLPWETAGAVIVSVAVVVLIGGAACAAIVRRWSPLLISGVATVSIALGLIPGSFTYVIAREHAFVLAADQGRSLVDAIGRFVVTEGLPPQSLEKLLPQYISEIPGTGVPLSPTYEYGPTSGPCPSDNAWYLSVDAYEAGMSDYLLYCPHQNYRSVGSGRAMSQWAYIYGS